MLLLLLLLFIVLVVKNGCYRNLHGQYTWICSFLKIKVCIISCDNILFKHFIEHWPYTVQSEVFMYIGSTICHHAVIDDGLYTKKNVPSSYIILLKKRMLLSNKCFLKDFPPIWIHPFVRKWHFLDFEEEWALKRKCRVGTHLTNM